MVLSYVTVDVVLQLLPPHYSVIADAESDLAVGPFGWIMSINFFGRGVTCAALLAAILLAPRQPGSGMPRRSRPRDRQLTTACALLAIAGACSALIAFFPTDIPSASGTGIHPATLHGTIHVAGATTGFVLALTSFVLLTIWMSSPPNAARMPQLTRLRRPIRIALAVAALGLVALAASIAIAPRLLGLTERICLLGILAWVFIVALGLRRGGFDTAAPASRAYSTGG